MPMKSLLTILLILSLTWSPPSRSAEAVTTSSADDWLGHETYFRAIMSDPSSTVSQARKSIDTLMGEEKAVVASGDQRTNRESLKRAQLELGDLNRQLGRSLLKQNVVLVVAFTGTALFATSLAGRIGLEGSERLLGEAEYAVPNRTGLGWINKPLLTAKGFLGRFGKAAQRITVISGVVGSVGTFTCFIANAKTSGN